MEVLVSIIVPVYNCEKYIQQCLTSLMNQTWECIEVIIIDDGSKDSTVEIVKNNCSLDSRIKLYTQSNSGPSVARNNGISKASGEYIAFCDADDNVSKNYIDKLVKVAIKNDYDIVSCGYTDISKYGKVKLNDFYKGREKLDKDEFVNSVFTGVGGTIWGKIFKSEIIKNNNIKMNPNIYMCEDMIFVLNYVMKCKNYGAISSNLYNYNRLNDNSISMKINLQYSDNLTLVLEEIERILSQNRFKNDYIDNILGERIKNLVITLIMNQHVNKDYCNKQKLDNIKKIINNKYYIRYRDNLSRNTLSEKIIVLLINKELLNLLNYYTGLLYKLQKLKNKIKKVD